MSDESYDIVIVGGGLVGNSLALALAQSSLRVAVVEAIDYEQQPIHTHSISSCDATCAQSSSGVYIPVHEQRDKHTTKSQLEMRRVDDNRAIGLSYTSQRILQKLGVWSKIESKAHPIDSVHVSLQGRFGVATISAAEQGLPSLGCNVDIQYLQKILADSVRVEAHLSLYAPYKVSACQRSEGQWQLTLTDGRIEKTLEARLVVAADGSDSKLRHTMGITAQVWDYQQSALVSRLTFSKPLHNRSYERFTPLGLMAILPAGEYEATFIWSTTQDKATEWQNADEKTRLQQLQSVWGYRLGRLRSISPAVHYPLRRVEANELYREGFVLIGNAAQTLHPVAAQGFNLGLRSATMLAAVLQSAQKIGRDYAEAAILAEYVDTQAADRKQIARFTHFLVSHQWQPLALCGLEWVPGAKSLLARLGLGGAQKALWV